MFISVHPASRAFSYGTYALYRLLSAQKSVHRDSARRVISVRPLTTRWIKLGYCTSTLICKVISCYRELLVAFIHMHPGGVYWNNFTQPGRPASEWLERKCFFSHACDLIAHATSGWRTGTENKKNMDYIVHSTCFFFFSLQNLHKKYNLFIISDSGLFLKYS